MRRFNFFCYENAGKFSRKKMQLLQFAQKQCNVCSRNLMRIFLLNNYIQTQYILIYGSKKIYSNIISIRVVNYFIFKNLNMLLVGDLFSPFEVGSLTHLPEHCFGGFVCWFSSPFPSNSVPQVLPTHDSYKLLHSSSKKVIFLLFESKSIWWSINREKKEPTKKYLSTRKTEVWIFIPATRTKDSQPNWAKQLFWLGPPTGFFLFLGV